MSASAISLDLGGIFEGLGELFWGGKVRRDQIAAQERLGEAEIEAREKSARQMRNIILIGILFFVFVIILFVVLNLTKR